MTSRTIPWKAEPHDSVFLNFIKTNRRTDIMLLYAIDTNYQALQDGSCVFYEFKTYKEYPFTYENIVYTY